MTPQFETRNSPLEIPRALSIRQPWAWLIAHGYKDIENRSRRTRFRGRFLIHASATMTRADYAACMIFIASMEGTWRVPAPDLLPRGGIVGEAEILDCVADSKSPWFTGEYGYVLANQKTLPFHPCKGALGFFKTAV
jgi:hypothetical protein